MYILLAAATPLEIKPLTAFLEGSPFGAGDPMTDVTTGLLITGIGSLPAGHALMRGIAARRPDLVIMGGIAGCYTANRNGEVVVVREEILGDLGVWEEQRFQTVFDLGLADNNTPPFSAGSLVNPYEKLLALTGLEQVRGITINEITTDPRRIDWLQQNIRPVVESMEGGALHYVCLREGIPFLQIRGISNEVGVRDKSKWSIGPAIENLNKELIRLLKILKDTGKDLL